MTYSSDKATDTMLRQVAALPGWSVKLTRGGHIRVTSPAGAPVFIAKTPSDPRDYRNSRALLRRAGAPL